MSDKRVCPECGTEMALISLTPLSYSITYACPNPDCPTKLKSYKWRCVNKECNWMYSESQKCCPRCGSDVNEIDPFNDEPEMP